MCLLYIYDKYLGKIDRFLARTFKGGHFQKMYHINDVIGFFRDQLLWNKITATNSALRDLLPPNRTSGCYVIGDTIICFQETN